MTIKVVKRFFKNKITQVFVPINHLSPPIKWTVRVLALGCNIIYFTNKVPQLLFDTF